MKCANSLDFTYLRFVAETADFRVIDLNEKPIVLYPLNDSVYLLTDLEVTNG